VNRTSLVAALLALAAAVPAAAQRPQRPRFLGWEPPGFDFSPEGVWRVKARRVMEARTLALHRGDFRALNSGLALAGPARSTMAVAETLFVPAVLFRYKDTDTTLSRDTAQYSSVLFSSTPPGGRPYTVRTFYEQMSNGIFSMQGRVIGWANLDSNEVYYAGTPGTCTGNPYGGTSCNGLFSLAATFHMQKGMRQALSQADVTVDFGQFDNDGPDGIPNSGDDDGYVDMVMFVQPALDGACGPASNNHLWSHRFALVDSSETFYQDFTTNDPWTGHAGQFIKVRNYFLQSGVGGASACDSTAIMPVGTAAHESGHGLDLPDLYDVSNASEGIGEWGLMGSGNYTSAFSPSRMEAWSLQQLGWVNVVPILASGTYSVGAAPTSDTTFLLNVAGANPRGEYFLLENRESSLADSAMIRAHCATSGNPANCGGGLMIWHIDQQQITAHGFTVDNTVNDGPIHGVELVQADHLGQLDLGTNRGDAGDPYPGTTGNTVFSALSSPAALKNSDSTSVGWTVDSIVRTGTNGPLSFRLTFDSGAAPVAVVSTKARPAGLMGYSYADTLKASGGTGSFSWAKVGGSLPSGLSLAASGAVSGIPAQIGSFSYYARVTSGIAQTTDTFTINVTAPVLATPDVVAQVLGTASALSAGDLKYLDLLGNNNGGLDLGDFLAWVQATGAPLSVVRQVLQPRRGPTKGGRP